MLGAMSPRYAFCPFPTLSTSGIGNATQHLSRLFLEESSFAYLPPLQPPFPNTAPPSRSRLPVVDVYKLHDLLMARQG